MNNLRKKKYCPKSLPVTTTKPTNDKTIQNYNIEQIIDKI